MKKKFEAPELIIYELPDIDTIGASGGFGNSEGEWTDPADGD